MRLNRRDFIRVGTIGTAGFAAASCGGGGAGVRARPALGIRITGLSLVHKAGNTVTVQLIDGSLFPMIGAHQPQLIVPASLIDPSSTVAHTPHPNDATLRVIDLKNKSVTTPGTGGGSPNVDLEDTAIGSTPPTTPAGWKSIRHSARLKTICGATQITDTSKFYGSVQINHGHLVCGQPDGQVGSTTVWTFKNPATGQPVTPPQAVSNVVVCQTNLDPSGAQFSIGGQSLVFVAGQSGEVTIDNMPLSAAPYGTCSSGATVCADHLSVYYDLVNAKVKPTVEGAGPPPLPQIDPNYCPPGFLD